MITSSQRQSAKSRRADQHEALVLEDKGGRFVGPLEGRANEDPARIEGEANKPELERGTSNGSKRPEANRRCRDADMPSWSEEAVLWAAGVQSTRQSACSAWKGVPVAGDEDIRGDKSN